MKFWSIFQFEFSYQLRRITTWLFFVVIALVAFSMVRDNFLTDALYHEFFINSPYVIAFTSVFGGFVWVLSSASVAGESAARDIQVGMHSLVYTSPISKLEYLGGRLLGALAINTMLLLAVPVGIMISVYMPGIDSQVIGPFRTLAYLRAFVLINVPTLLAATAIQFAFAVVVRKPIASYLGSLMIFGIAYPVCMVIGYFWSPEIARLIDPVGVVSIVMELNKWTPIEKSSRIFTLDSILEWNRVLWISVSVVMFVFTLIRFKFIHHTGFGFSRKTRKARKVHVELAETSLTAIPHVERKFGLTVYLQQLIILTFSSFWTVVRRRGGLIIFGITAFFTFLSIPKNMTNMDVPLLPRTDYVLTFLTAPLDNLFTPWVIIPLLIIVYVGELTWRERDMNVSEITHTVPVPEWILFLGKYFGLSLVLVVWMGTLTVVGILVQLVMNYHHHEIGLFVRVLFGLQLIDYLLFILVVFFIHTIVNQKYIGHLVALLFYGAILMAEPLGFNHHLLAYASSPAWSYTDMLGFDSFIVPWLWFKSYWIACGLLIAVGIRLFWVRSMDHDLKSRLQLLKLRFTRNTILFAGIVVVVIIALGGFIFYNTNVLNQYTTPLKQVALTADYEKTYKRYENVPQPNLASVKVMIDLHPAERSAEVHGLYLLVNRRQQPIDTIHLDVAAHVQTEVDFSSQFKIISNDERLRHRMYLLDEALQPGDSIILNFDLIYKSIGFTNGGFQNYVLPNSSYFTNNEWMPSIGYQSNRELRSAGIRRSYGLGPRPLVTSLYDTIDRYNVNGNDHYDFEALLSTSEGQVAIAPGSLTKSWSEDGRHYFNYIANAPIGPYKIFSSNYSLHESTWHSRIDSSRSVRIEIYYKPEHARNLDRIIKSATASLDYYTSEFSQYEYDVLRFVERPGRGLSLHAEATTIDYTEGFSLFNPQDNPEDFDLVFAVVGHEVGHQWWGAQLPHALVEGAGIMGESLAWFSSMGVVEETFGREHLRKLLTFFRKPYPIAPIRQTVPLIRATDSYADYRKGPFALYCLSEYTSRDTINHALRQLLAHHTSRIGPKATTLDLYKELQAVTPDSLQYLVHDLFEANTLWELKTTNAVAKKNSDNTWNVSMDVTSRKVTVDSAGTETIIPMNDWIEVGVFAGDTVLYKQMHHVTSPKEKFMLTVPAKPSSAGIDPYVLLIDAKPEDNSREVEIEDF